MQGEQGALVVAGLVGVDELVAALLDAGEVGVGIDVVDALVEEVGPVVFDDLVEQGDELGAVVGDDLGGGVAAFAEEEDEEIAQVLLVVGELADGGVGCLLYTSPIPRD